MAPNITIRKSTTHQTETHVSITQTAPNARGGDPGPQIERNTPGNANTNRTSVHGFLYPVNRVRIFSKACKIRARTTGPSFSPDVGVNQIFNKPAGNHLHPAIFRATVIIGCLRFLIYGHDSRNGAMVNESIRAIRPTSPWSGEVFVLEFGTRKEFLLRPRINRRILNKAVILFVSRITEARDMGKALPTQITA